MARRKMSKRDDYIAEMLYLEYFWNPKADKTKQVSAMGKPIYSCRCGFCGAEYMSTESKPYCKECEEDYKYLADKYGKKYDRLYGQQDLEERANSYISKDFRVSDTPTCEELGLENNARNTKRPSSINFYRTQCCDLYGHKSPACKRCMAGRNINTGKPDTTSNRVCPNHPVSASNTNRYLLKEAKGERKYTDYYSQLSDVRKKQIADMNDYTHSILELPAGTAWQAGTIAEIKRAQRNIVKQFIEEVLDDSI